MSYCNCGSDVCVFVYRVGRASRGGRHGRATSIYDESSR